MSARCITHFLKVNSNLTSGTRETREFRLPRMNPFPKLNRSAVAARVGPESAAGVGRAGAGGGPGTAGIAPTSMRGGAPLPEMVTDLLDPATRYHTMNVRRAGAAPQWLGPHRRMNDPRPRGRFGQWMERIWGAHRAARW